MKRLTFIDNLRILLTALVVVHHVAIAYGGSGGWYHISPSADNEPLGLLLTWMLAVNQSFFMSFFFFLAAYFTPFSLKRKGSKAFIKDRFIRLGIPLAVFTLVLNPLLVYGIRIYNGETEGSLAQVWWAMITKYIGPGPLWFVFTLLIFSLLYVFVNRMRKISEKPRAFRFPGNLTIFLFIITSGLLAFGIRLFYPVGQSWFGLQFGYFVLYIAFFVLGIIAAQSKWLENLKHSQVNFWFSIALFAILFMPFFSYFSRHLGDNYSGGFNLQAFFYAMWEPFVCVGMILKLIDIFQSRFNQAGKIFKCLAASAYTVYIIHPFFVIGITMLLDMMTMTPALKFLLNSALTISLCFVCAEIIRKIPGFNHVL